MITSFHKRYVFSIKKSRNHRFFGLLIRVLRVWDSVNGGMPYALFDGIVCCGCVAYIHLMLMTWKVFLLPFCECDTTRNISYIYIHAYAYTSSSSTSGVAALMWCGDESAECGVCSCTWLSENQMTMSDELTHHAYSEDDLFRCRWISVTQVAVPDIFVILKRKWFRHIYDEQMATGGEDCRYSRMHISNTVFRYDSCVHEKGQSMGKRRTCVPYFVVVFFFIIIFAWPNLGDLVCKKCFTFRKGN